MSTGLNREEQETIINFNKAEDMASIFTYEKRWQKHLEKRLGLRPIKDNGFGAREYLLDKHLLRLPQPKRKREMTKEEKEKIATRLRSARTTRIPQSR